jgi:hypothetical protein
MTQPSLVGAPQRRRKENSQLTYKQCTAIEKAFSRAKTLHLPLNTHVCIHWAYAPSRIHPVDRWQRFHEAANAWLNRRGVGFTWAYVWEAGLQNNHGRLMHIHLVVHVPEHLLKDFRVMVAKWVTASTNPGQYQDRAVKVKPLWTMSSEWLMRYLLKGSSPKAREDFKVLKRHPTNQGKVMGKRSEVSLNLRDVSWPDAGEGPVPLEKVFYRAAGR